MDTTTTKRPPMSVDQIVDLRRRVLAREEVSDEELKHALESLALARASSAASVPTKEPAYNPKGSLADRLAGFRARSQKTDAAGEVQLPQQPPKGNGEDA